MENKHNMQANTSKNYRIFLLMMIVSFLIMYAVMFLNVDAVDHIYLSTTRAYMALLMVAPMSIVMLLMMGRMYPNKKLNSGIILAAVVLFGLVLTGLRRQVFISDEQYMKAMIPHHSSAILTSKHANLKDPEVKKLSLQIIASQEKEIAEMKAMLSRIDD